MEIGNRYRIERSLGRGGIGEALLVRDRLQEDCLAVVKRVARGSFAKEIESLRKEFVTLKRLAHPNIARVLDFGSDDEFVFFVEEYVDGPDIFQATHEANYNQILASLAQLLRALHYLHREGLVHGDLKPENILVIRGASLFRNDAVRLIDFGLARHFSDRSHHHPSGTIHFMAPEVLLERPSDHRADLYALGVCLYRMITGRYPFVESSGGIDLLIRDQIEKRPVEPRRFRADLPKGLNEITMTLLDKSPEGRFDSASAVLRTLNGLEGEKYPLWTETELRYSLHLPLWKGGEIVPPPWTLPDIESFLKERLRLEAIPPAWERVLELTNGDPGRVVTLVESWLAEGIIRIENDRVVFLQDSPREVAGFESIAKRRFLQIEKRKREILELCAFARSPLSEDLLGRITRFPPDQLRTLLEELEEERWLRRVLHDGRYHYQAPDRRFGEGERPAVPDPDTLLDLIEETYRMGNHLQASRHLALFFERREGGEARFDPAKGLSRDQRFRLFGLGSLISLETGDHKRAKGFCEELLRLPGLTAEERGKIRNRKGWIAYREGDYPAAQGIFGESEKDWEEAGNVTGRVSVANFQGMTCQALRDQEGARRSYGKALSLLPEGDPFRPFIRMNLAIAAQEGGDFSAAVENFEAAQRESTEGKDRHLEVRLLNNLANLYLFLGRLDRAGEAAHASLRLAIENGLSNLEGHNYLLLSVIADKEGNLPSCRDFVEKARVVFERYGTAVERANASLHEAYYWHTAGDDARALNVLAGIRENFPSETGVLAQCDLLEGKIVARRDPEDPDVLAEGRGLLKKALAYYEGQGDLANLFEVVATLGRLYRRGRPRDAARWFEKSLVLLERLAEKIPEEYRDGFFRDRKREKILAELSSLKECPSIKTREGETMQNEALVEIARINRLLASEQNLNYLLETILEESLELLQGERGFLLLLEKGDPKAFRIGISRNMDREALEKDASEGRYSTTIARQTAVSGRSTLVADARADERFKEAASVIELEIRSALAVPMKIGPEVIGVIYVDNRFRKGSFDEPHQRLLEAFADQAALAIRNGRQIEDIRAHQRDLETSKRQIEELNKLLQGRLDTTEQERQSIQGKYHLQQEELKLRYSYDHIIGKGERLREVLRTLDRITDSDVTVLLMGESGTGKELAARALHYNGPRKEAPFVTENCAAFSEQLLESELFGHLKGSFTGAIADKEGLFEAAEGGTVFLDEIGDMSPGMQAKLLRVLQERQIRPIGANDYRKVNVRVIVATNQNLPQLVKADRFREDLFYRINVVRVVMPPLRERKEDIPPLVAHFLKQYREETGKSARVLPKAMELLIQYEWPGNIRELANEIQKCCAMGAKVITPDLLSEKIREEPSAAHRVISLNQQVSNTEKSVIIEALKKFRYSRIRTAKALGVSRITLYKKMKAYGITARKSDYKSMAAGTA